MSWRIIDVAEDGRHLHAERDWLVIEEKHTEIGRVPGRRRFHHVFFR